MSLLDIDAAMVFIYSAGFFFRTSFLFTFVAIKREKKMYKPWKEMYSRHFRITVNVQWFCNPFIAAKYWLFPKETFPKCWQIFFPKRGKFLIVRHNFLKTNEIFTWYYVQFYEMFFFFLFFGKSWPNEYCEYWEYIFISLVLDFTSRSAYDLILSPVPYFPNVWSIW